MAEQGLFLGANCRKEEFLCQKIHAKFIQRLDDKEQGSGVRKKGHEKIVDFVEQLP